MRWVFAIVCSCLLGGVAGWGGGTCGFIIGWAVGALASWSSGRTPNLDAPARRAAESPRPLVVAQRPPAPPPVLVQRPPGPLVRVQSPGEPIPGPPGLPVRRPFEIQVVIGASAQPASVPARGGRSKPKLVWHVPGQTVEVGEVPISGGMVYTLDRPLEWPGEPSALVSSLPVGRVAADPSEDFGYYPGYDRITPAQRRAYLEWLAAGRGDSDPARRSLGHLFVFFYGLERRIVLERDRDPALLEELIRLLQHYGPAHRSRSLKSYFLQLLHFGGWQLGGEAYRALWPRLLEFDGERADAEGLRFVLASLYQGGEPMDWSVAYRVALANEESRRSTVVSRAREQFWALFAQRFNERYPGGMVLQAEARAVTIAYRPASNALVQMRYSQQKGAETLYVDLPDVAGLVRQFAELPELWNACVDALTSYSRTIGSKKTGDAAALAAWHALPVELRRVEAHPVRGAFEQLLAGLPREGEHMFAPAGTLAALAGVGERAKLTGAQSQQAAALARGLGWSITPDPALTGLPLAWTQELALYPAGSHDTGALHLRGLVRCLYLAVAVAASHGEFAPGEMESFHGIMASQIEEADWPMIRATEAALGRDPNVALRAMPSIAKAIPADSRAAVLGMMVRVAAADGEVSLDEQKVLRRMARAFGLDTDAVDNVLRGDKAFREVVVEGATGSRAQGERIPPPGAVVPAFALDRARIAALTVETREVISLLSAVMADPEEAAVPVEEVAAVSSLPSVSADWLGELDPRFHPALLSLIERDEWSLADFDGLAERHRLLPDDLLDSINTWSDEALGDFLLVKMDCVRVFRLLIPAGQIPSLLHESPRSHQTARA